MTESFRAVLLEQVDRTTRAKLADVPTDRLPPGEVEVEVSHSCLNYKDALAITGAGKIVREFPFVPGIDLAGTVRSSGDPRFGPGQEVFLTGWGVGERHWGGLAQRARVKADWLLPKPDGLTLAETMAIGTAGFTAMLGVLALEEQGVAPGDGEIVVTGAAGGVGSVAIPLLRRAGFAVVASTGRAALADYLTGLGAQRVVDRAQFSEGSKAPLDSAVWAGAIDSVGGATLVNLLKGMRYHGVVAACGLAGGAAFEGTVFPFILRGVRLIGIDSAYFPADRRPAVWARLARDLDLGLLARMTGTIALADVPAVAPDFLAGRVQGRVVVDIRA
ncbi:MAG: MDR family oxidoreductase [Geminicoccaceae bacterium]